MLKVASALLACRDPKQADVTDEALWIVFDALRKVTTGESKYLRLTDDLNDTWGTRIRRDKFNKFQFIHGKKTIDRLFLTC